MQKHRFGHRRNNPLGEEEHTTPPLTNRTNVNFRNSALNEYRVNLDPDSATPFSRYSFDQEAKPVLQ